MTAGKPLSWAAAGVVLTLAAGLVSGLPAQSTPVALQGGRIITVTDGIIENGTLLIRDGRIAAVGASVSVPSDAVVVDMTGKTLMPGLVDGFTNLGAADYPSLGEDDDEATTPVTPEMRIIDGFNPANRFIPLARRSGVTTALSAPAPGNLLTGQSALVRLDGSTVDEMALRFPVGVHASLGEAPKARYGAKNRAPMTRMGSAALLRQTMVDALGYAEKLAQFERKKAAFESGEAETEPTPVPRNLKMEALLPVVRGETPLIVGADRFDDIYTALRISSEFELEMILAGGAEAHRLAPELSEREIPVIWGPSTAPQRELEAWNGSPETPAALAAAGIRFAFQTGSIANVGGLLQEARSAFRFGLPYDEAIKGLTLYPAMIFGVGQDLGSLEAGKIADIIVLGGDPLEESAVVEIVFIGGNRVPNPE